MPRIVRTARGETVDFDAILIKQQIAQAPMNIEVARRKEFIDSKEGKPRGQKNSTIDDTRPDGGMFISNEPIRSMEEQAPVNFTPTQPSDFEIEAVPVGKKQKPVEEPVPILPERTK
jgi:hypothetical protein